MAFIIHFHGEGRGYYSGVRELVNILESKPTASELEEMAPPGFKVESVTDTDIDQLPSSFPFDRILQVT
jgi:hypothetical protein